MAKMVQLRVYGGNCRTAYTLVELLVVIAIIGILGALTAGATIQVMGYQRNSNTETSIKSLSTLLDRQWRAVIDQANQEPIPSSVVTTLAGGDPRRARVIWKKLRLNQEFPMNFSEILPSAAQLTILQSYGVPPPKASYVALLQQMGVTYVVPMGPPVEWSPPQSPWNPPSGPLVPPGLTPPMLASESAVCLYLALQENRKGVGITTDDLPVASVTSKIYIDQNRIDPTTAKYAQVSVKELVDAWGFPLALYRWPTANAELNGLNPAAPGSTAASFGDPLDPEGLLLNPTWWTTPAGNNTPQWSAFQTVCHSLTNGSVSTTTTAAGSLPQPTISVASTASFLPAGLIAATTSAGVQLVSYTGVTATAFTGCGGGTGSISAGAPVQQVGGYMVPVIASAGKDNLFGLSLISSTTPDPMAPDGTTNSYDNIYNYRLRVGQRGDQ